MRWINNAGLGALLLPRLCCPSAVARMSMLGEVPAHMIVLAICSITFSYVHNACMSVCIPVCLSTCASATRMYRHFSAL